MVPPLRIGDQPRVPPRRQPVGGAIPGQARPQIGELVGRVAPGQHVQDGHQHVARERRVRVGALDQPLQRRHAQPLLLGDARHDGDDLLGQNVQRVARHARRLDGPLGHAARDHRRLQQIGAMLGEDAADASRAHLVAGAPDALQPARHAARRLDLDDQIDRRHVDPQLQRAGRHQAAQRAGLQHLLDLRALRPRHAAVVRADQPFCRQFVDPLRQPLAEAPAVGEHDRAAVGADQLDQARVDGGPDPGRPALMAFLVFDDPLAADRLHFFDRDLDGQLQPGRLGGVDQRDRSIAAQETANLVQRTLRGRQPDALRFTRRQRRQPLQRECQVRAALGGRQGVDLVDDDGLAVAQGLARRGPEHQVQRLRRGDQDVGWVAQHLAAIPGRRVAGAHGDARRPERLPQRLGRPRDSGQRRPQVALDVVGQGLQRRDVESPHAASFYAIREPSKGSRTLPRRLRWAKPSSVHATAAELVQAPQEGRQRLSAAGRSQQQRVLATRDGGPAGRLNRGRARKRPLEPPSGGRLKGAQEVRGRGDSGSLSRKMPANKAPKATLTVRLGRGHGGAPIQASDADRCQQREQTDGSVVHRPSHRRVSAGPESEPCVRSLTDRLSEIAVARPGAAASR